ncbi:uncharacterized protein LOC131162404 [Malania oleifera]|uniref:uncharacterized protein LOC131162404 n=1 Tax=Malania oleifera TaxID=397392 RepID=UPI0025AE1DBF|nr:uncharacterized protein LOC131162404 [Malania oleifera]
MRWWWRLFVRAMTGGRCHRRRKMMGRGADGGCGTEEKPCPVARVPAKIPAKLPEEGSSVGVDFFAQAEKVLSERSPFDAEDASAPAIPTLPASLAGFLSKHSDSRKRHKKSHSGVDAKSSKLDRSRSSNIWAETEEYFRDVTSDDIKRLFDVCSFCSSAARKCFFIPFLGNAKGSITVNGDAANGAKSNANSKEGGSDILFLAKEEQKDEGLQSMEIAAVATDVLPQEEKNCSVSQSLSLSNSLEWLLGYRNKIFVTSDRSKKRKLVSEDGRLEKLLVAQPVEGNSSLCHFCSLGDMGDELNRLIICGSCNAVVHEKCYGLREEVDGSWLCSWCKHRNCVGKVLGADSNDLSLKPCVLCPKQGGALKPIYNSVGSVEFAHLFCSQWMPEVYVEDTRLMEPILNVDGIKETRRKLVCYLCKVKHGMCVRCSNGICRTSFHPICAREARHRMEIWGKFGCDVVELRAFCLKHSEVQDTSSTNQSLHSPVAVGNNPCVVKHAPVTLSLIKPHMFKVGHKNGDKIAVHMERSSTNSDKMGKNKLQEIGISDNQTVGGLQPECGDACDLPIMEAVERNSIEEVNASNFPNFAHTLKKLIDRGKVNAKDVALEIGVSPDSLATTLDDDSLVPDLCCKIAQWLRNHAFMGSSQKNLKVKVKSSISSIADIRADDGSGAVPASESDISGIFPVKSVLPRRRTKNDMRILKDNIGLCSSKEMFSGNGMVTDEVKTDQNGVQNNSSKHSKEMLCGNGVVMDNVKTNQIVGQDQYSKDSNHIANQKSLVEPVEFQDSLSMRSPKSEGIPVKPQNYSSETDQAGEAGIHAQSTSLISDNGGFRCSVAGDSIVPDLINAGSESSSYIHPFIHEKLMQVPDGVLGSREREFSSMEASSSAGVCCYHRNQHSSLMDKIKIFDGVHLEQLVKAKNMGILDLSPEDEVEGELIYFQHRLLNNGLAKKCFIDDLICKVAKSLPEAIHAARERRWDAVLVNQYLCELREAKKQGRKERRHKEAQAILAAATAAAAASSRVSSFRKDVFDESVYQKPPKLNTNRARSGLYPQLGSRAKETLPRVAFARVSSEKHSNFPQLTSDFSKEHPRSCDICGRSETILNPILICSGCKVAVHLDCYRSAKDSTGPWYCELCEELSNLSGVPVVNSWEKPCLVAECGLCGGTTGAFRKSTDGQWIHAFCAEWVLESTYRRGQLNLVDGMEALTKGSDVCYLCHRKHGVCIKCNYGHCQSTFHPSCARDVGLYMNMKTKSGLLKHKAYCEKHSVEQRAKAETQKHGVEELKSLKQIRVELERLRLLCERIIKREKLKRELVLCSHEILASRRDSVALSVLVHSPFLPPDVSSESATTSLKGHTDDYKSCSEAIQRSDDVTVDSTVSSKHRIKLPISMDTDQKTDDSSASQHLFIRKPERPLFSGKQIPRRNSSIASQNLSDDGERWSKHRKHTETFQKELVMTSDQASMKNQRLPKGYVYVPIGCLPKEKQVDQDAHSHETVEHDG